MPGGHEASDFGDDELEQFIASVSRLAWTAAGEVPAWVRDEAERFAASPPVPSPEEMRERIQQAAALPKGWEHADDRAGMLHVGIVSFYLLRWIDRIADGHPHRDRTPAYRVRFTPVLESGA